MQNKQQSDFAESSKPSPQANEFARKLLTGQDADTQTVNACDSHKDSNGNEEMVGAEVILINHRNESAGYGKIVGFTRDNEAIVKWFYPVHCVETVDTNKIVKRYDDHYDIFENE